MNRSFVNTLHIAIVLMLATPLNAQIFKLHDASLGVAATGQYTTTLTDNTVTNSASAAKGQGVLCAGRPVDGATADHLGMGCDSQAIDATTLFNPSTTDSPGALVTLRDRPLSWARVEFNYQYTKFSERYFAIASPTGNAAPLYFPTNLHEASAAYVLQRKMGRVSPYVSVGGGALYLQPVNTGSAQWRGTGLVELGADLQTYSRLGFRLGARDLTYRSPTYANRQLNAEWVSTEEPFAGVYVKF